MTDSQLLDRITVCPDILGGKPTIRGMHFSVQQVLGMLPAGDTAETILREYPFLEPEDIQACLLTNVRQAAAVDLGRAGHYDSSLR